MKDVQLQVLIDPPQIVSAIVPDGLTDEGVLTELLGMKLKDAGNPLSPRAMYSHHMGNGVFEFQDAERREFWLLHMDHGFHALRVPDLEVMRFAGFVKKP